MVAAIFKAQNEVHLQLGCNVEAVLVQVCIAFHVGAVQCSYLVPLVLCQAQARLQTRSRALKFKFKCKSKLVIASELSCLSDVGTARGHQEALVKSSAKALESPVTAWL